VALAKLTKSKMASAERKHDMLTMTFLSFENDRILPTCSSVRKARQTDSF
jgi:hypothetical protein